MARTAPSGSPGVGWGGEPRTRWAVAQAECQRITGLPSYTTLSPTAKSLMSVLGFGPIACAGPSTPRAQTAPTDVERLSRAPFRRVQRNCFENEHLQRGLIYRVGFVEINGAHGLTIQPRVKEVHWILDLRTVREGQSHGVLERVGDADYSIMRPHWDTFWPGGLFPLHLFD